MKLIFLSLLTIFGLFSCKKHNEEYTLYQDGPVTIETGGTLSTPNLPADNPLTKSKVELGRHLFYEKMLSGNNEMNCASCHNQTTGFSDTARYSTGIDGIKGKRQAMSTINLAWNSNKFFWDGRANFLRDQTLKPIQDVAEMHENLAHAIEELKGNSSYRILFKLAFQDGQITAENMSLALEAFLFTVVSNNSKYDRFLRGEVALTDSEERGRVLFFGEYNPGFPSISGADCAHCHSGNNFENDQFINNGLNTDATFTDLGYFNVSGNVNDKAKFKLPTLRNIELMPPYMHDGRFKTLEEVVDHYNSGIQISSTTDPALVYNQSTGLMLDVQEKADLVAFLKTLTDPTIATNPNFSSPF
jgi:cytochrome c peroxidase